MTTALLGGLKTAGWAHQDAAAAFAEPKYGALLEMGMGTGKTRVVIDLIERRHHRRILIVCPTSVITDAVWPKELLKHSSRPYAVYELSGSIKDRASRLQAADPHGLPIVVITNYEAVWREPLATAIFHANFDLAVADECHRLKKPGGKASLFFSKLAQRVPWRLGLSGTPLSHGLLDAYAQCRFIDRAVFGTNFTAFKARYAVTNPYIPQMVVGYQNQDEFSEKFYSIAFHVGSEVLDLPEPTHIERRFHIGAPAQRIYHELERDFVTTVGSEEVTAANVLTRLLRLQQVTSGYVPTDNGERVEVDDEKRKALADTFEDISPDEPIVVFARFHADLAAIEALCAGTGRRYAELSGPRKELDVWKRGDADVLGVQIQSGGVGIDLTRARYCIYYSLDFSLANYQQSLARVHRPGQTRPVTYVHLIAAGTVEERIYKALDAKEDVVETVRRWARIYGR